MDTFRKKLLKNKTTTTKKNKGKVVRIKTCCTWWRMPVIPVIGRLKQEDHELRPAWAT
jgi:hypothetical protein